MPRHAGAPEARRGRRSFCQSLSEMPTRMLAADASEPGNWGGEHELPQAWAGAGRTQGPENTNQQGLAPNTPSTPLLPIGLLMIRLCCPRTAGRGGGFPPRWTRAQGPGCLPATLNRAWGSCQSLRGHISSHGWVFYAEH